MTVTIGGFEFNNLTAQPFGYEESDVKAGLTARQWAIQGLLTPSEWLTLNTKYTTWRTSRIQDADTNVSLVVGTTVTFSGTGAGGVTWTNVPCWFSSAPSAEQSGDFLAISVTLVDAAEALQVIIKTQQNAQATTEVLPDYGTYTLGTVVLTLTKPKESYNNGPQLQLTASGSHYLSGPLVVERLYDIEGYFDTTTYPTGWATIRSWYESQIVTTPSAGSYFPVSPPSASGEIKVINGVNTTRYTITVQLGRVL